MGRTKVYGKRIGAISLASYSRFAADSSGNETSPEVSVLCEVSNNVRTVLPTATVQSKQTIKQISESNDLSRSRKPGAIQETKQSTRSEKYQLDSKTNLNAQIPGSPLKGDGLRQNLKSPKKIKSTAIKSQTKSLPLRTSPRKAKASSADDLSLLFNSLKLNSSPECSIIAPQQQSKTTIQTPDAISEKTRSYLGPVLGCKNVTPFVSDFSNWMKERDRLTLEKVGEGSFGEVFRASCTDSEAVILKLMPLNTEKGKGSKSFTSIGSAANEIRLLERMQRVPGFVEFRGACVLVGSLPSRFVNLWKEYKASGRTVESRDPSKKASYASDQLWLLLEMSDAGRNLEPGQYAPPGETAVKGGRYLGLGRTWDIFWEVVKSVAKAEYWAHFEHRDLHLGNVCARDTTDLPDKEDLTLVSTEIPTPIAVNRSRLEITIIDYSLSRAFMDSEEEVLFYDFKKDKHILKGEGDLQYDMYRYMASAIGNRSPREYAPQTNVVWLWYLLNRLLAMTKELTARAKAKKRGYITKETRTLNILEEVQSLTDPEYMEHWEIDSAAALLGIGIERGWLLPADVFD